MVSPGVVCSRSEGMDESSNPSGLPVLSSFCGSVLDSSVAVASFIICTCCAEELNSSAESGSKTVSSTKKKSKQARQSIVCIPPPSLQSSHEPGMVVNRLDVDKLHSGLEVMGFIHVLSA